MDLIREKQLHVFLIVFNLCSWPIKYKKKCPVIFGYTLYTTVPVVIIECPVQLTGFLKSLRCIWMRDV